ncbi:hypothetical protein SAMN05216299_11156 [Nitrosospira sp. Nsp14]|nr:hypothetical protein SAMN05216299_11156 [Nitrosospira sp. Nsp14]
MSSMRTEGAWALGAWHQNIYRSSLRLRYWYSPVQLPGLNVSNSVNPSLAPPYISYDGILCSVTLMVSRGGKDSAKEYL